MAFPPPQYSQALPAHLGSCPTAEFGPAARRLPPPKNQYGHNASYTSQDRQHTRRQRTAIACRECRKRKIRCSGPEYGGCKNCIANGRECIFTPVSGPGSLFVPVYTVSSGGGRAPQLYGAYRQRFVPTASQWTAPVESQQHWQDNQSSSTTNISPLGGQQYCYTPVRFPLLQDCYTHAPSPPSYISPYPCAQVPSSTPPALPNSGSVTLPPIHDLLPKR